MNSNLVLCDLETSWLTLKNDRALLLCYFKLCASFQNHRLISTRVTVWKLPILGQNQQFLVPCDLQIWQMTLKNIRAPLLSNIKLCASFHCRMWIQTGVTVQKFLNGVLTSVILTFDLWPGPFAWMSILSMVITPDNFMMIRWEEHSEKGVTDRQTERSVLRAAWSQLKNGNLS